MLPTRPPDEPRRPRRIPRDPDEDDLGPLPQDLERFGDDAQECPSCGRQVFADTEVCYHCGRPMRRADRAPPPWVLITAGVVIAALVLAFVLRMF